MRVPLPSQAPLPAGILSVRQLDTNFITMDVIKICRYGDR